MERSEVMVRSMTQLEQEADELRAKIKTLEDAEGELSLARKELAIVEKMLAIGRGESVDAPESSSKVRAKRGAALTLVRAILDNEPTASDSQIVTIALEQPYAPSRSAIVDALKAIRAESPIEGAKVPT